MNSFTYDYWIYQKAKPKRKHLTNYLSNAVPPAIGSTMNLRSHLNDDEDGNQAVVLYRVVDLLEAPIRSSDGGVAVEQHYVEIYVEPIIL